MASTNPIFGDASILVQSGNHASVSAPKILKDVKYTMLYFSASWCPPCKSFTPVLSKWYLEHKSSNLELVFVSSDNNENDFNRYYQTMPWLSIPYENRDLVETLISKYEVTGFPTLIVVDNSTGAVLSRNGRTGVMNYPEEFPWL